MNKQRILLVHNYYQIPGGEDTVVANEKKMLEDNGHKVFMYTRHNNEIKSMNLFQKIKIPFETIYSFRTKREIKKLIDEEKIDIVHVHNTLPLISPSVYSVAKKCGAKVVQTIHNFRLLCPGATFTCNEKICEKCVRNGLESAIRNKCYRNSIIQTLIVVLMIKINMIIKSYDKVDAYIVLTKFSKEKMSEFIKKKNIYIKPNFTEKNDISISPEKERKYFIFVGRLDKLKGIDVLLKCWKSVKNEKLLIVGIGPEEDYIRNFIRINKITNIELIGKVENCEVKKLISKAKALIMPSIWYETFGMVNIESFSVGTPVIASDIGALSDIINDMNGMKFKTNSIDSLRKKVLEMADCSKSEFYSKSCINEYLNKYSKEINYLKLMDIYNSI